MFFLPSTMAFDALPQMLARTPLLIAETPTVVSLTDLICRAATDNKELAQPHPVQDCGPFLATSAN
jgi:hypothetical protein